MHIPFFVGLVELVKDILKGHKHIHIEHHGVRNSLGKELLDISDITDELNDLHEKFNLFHEFFFARGHNLSCSNFITVLYTELLPIT